MSEAGFTEPLIMGIVNATPDSFSRDGTNRDVAAAITLGKRHIESGAAIIDVGGESTRPGAVPVTIEEEIARILPVMEGLKPWAAAAGVLISIDTRNAETMKAALAAGADMLNDVSALTHDPASIEIAACSGKPVVLMHMQGTPQTMQECPAYDDVVTDVYRWLEARIEAARQAGIPRNLIIADPGIGFGKTFKHNLALMHALPDFKKLGVRLMAGVSRKGFIGRLSRNESPDQRLGGSLAAGLWCVMNGIDILRVHDVTETVQAIQVMQAIQKA